MKIIITSTTQSNKLRPVSFLAPAVLGQPGALEVLSVSESVCSKFLCRNDQAYNCLIHLRDNCTVTQFTVHVYVYTQHKQCTKHSQEWNRYIGTSVGIAVRWRLARKHSHKGEHCSLSPSVGRLAQRDKLWNDELSHTRDKN